MSNTTLSALFFAVAAFAFNPAQAAEMHSGHGGGSGSSTASSMGTSASCVKPHLSKFLPAHLSTVVPGSEFSFVAFNINKPDQIEVTVKNIVVEMDAEFKDPFYIIRGKLPESLVNTAARINVKVKAKSPHCETEGGWLIKIADQ